MTALPHCLQITPSDAPLNFQADIPGSKSITNRVLLIASLAQGPTDLSRVLWSDDSKYMMDALRQLGVDITANSEQKTCHISGVPKEWQKPSQTIFLGNAGTATRFLTAACALLQHPHTLTIDGIERMRERPIGGLVAPLKTLGCDVKYTMQDGFPPLQITGNNGTPLATNHIQLNPTLSSQYISALMMMAPLLNGGLTITFNGAITSRPYVDMTLSVMADFGAQHSWQDTQTLVISQGQYIGRSYAIEPDASGATYPLAIAAVVPGSSVVIPGLNGDSLQGDAKFIHHLAQMGCDTTVNDNSLVLHRPHAPLKAIDVDLEDMPDTAQTLAAVCLHAEGSSILRGLHTLRVKETDRIAALETQLGLLGATTEVTSAEALVIHPPAKSQLLQATLPTYDDHRCAMSMAVALAGNKGATQPIIEEPSCCSKTWPDFFIQLQNWGIQWQSLK